MQQTLRLPLRAPVALVSMKETTLMEHADTGTFHFANANSRQTCFTVHNVSGAHALTLGEGVDVGILDHLFAMDRHTDLYASGRDFVGNAGSLAESEGHGFWMASVVREIAPKCRIHALNVFDKDPDSFSAAIAAAVRWAASNGINVLTCSHGMYAYNARRADVDAAVAGAVDLGVATCFLHYDHEANMLPYGVFPYLSGYARTPDLNVWHYDYSVLFCDQYREFLGRSEPPRSGNDIPFFSMSSTAAATGAFVALLMALKPELPPQDYRKILIDTSYAWSYEGVATFETGESPRVADVGRAAALLSGRKGRP